MHSKVKVGEFGSPRARTVRGGPRCHNGRQECLFSLSGSRSENRLAPPLPAERSTLETTKKKIDDYIINRKRSVRAFGRSKFRNLITGSSEDIRVRVVEVLFLRSASLCVLPTTNARPFDGLTPLRGEWDEYFLLCYSIGGKPR
jgi:hypothetical protein